MPHADTVCGDPTTHLVYFPLEDVEGRLEVALRRRVAALSP
jgi:hypothetical protein